MNRHFLALAKRLHRFPLLRRLAKRVAAGRTVQQPFHGGVICADAVEHAWAWIGNRRLEDFDRFLQDRLVDLTIKRPNFLDIGCNLGVMTLSVLLRNRGVTTVSVDPNQRAIELLNRSIHLNSLGRRAQTLCLAVSNSSGSLFYEAGGSFVGHVVEQGKSVPAVPLLELIAQQVRGPSVIKIDVEGYETALVDSLAHLPNLRGSALVIELHPRGFNGLGDPTAVVNALRSQVNLSLRVDGGSELAALDPTGFHQLEVLWPDE